MATNYVDAWDGCLQLIRDKIAPQSFDTWFRPIKPVKLDQQVLTIEGPNKFFYEWLEEHYVGLLREAIHAELGSQGRLEYAIVIDNQPSQGTGHLYACPASPASRRDRPTETRTAHSP